MSSTTIRLTRKELYEEIWKISVAGVSQKYGIPYAKCLAKIKAAQIPVPPSGYWTKLNFGKSVEQTPLSGDGDAVVELLQETLLSTADAKKTEQVLHLQEETASKPSSVSLEFLPEEERQVVLNAAAQILLPQEHARMRPEIVAHRKRIAEWNKRKRQQEQEFGANWNRGRQEVPPPFAERVSEEQQPRIFRLIDALAKAMIPLGWCLTNDLQFAWEQDTVTLTFSESTDKILHTPTKEENLKLLKYEEEHKKYSLATKPKIRKYDSVYNGRLSLCVNGAKTFRDCRSYVLEDCLGDMMLSIYSEAEQVKQARLAREEAERQRQEMEKKREEQRQRYNAEVDRTLALVNCASDYEIACRIRAYVSAMEKVHADQDLSAWASWARAKADWYDPTIAKEDELLGKREHEKNQESKGPQHKGYWW